MLPIRSPLALLVVVALSGCFSPTQREANRFLKNGAYVDATTVWLEAVEADTEDPVARRHLGELAPDAYRLMLDVAHEHEAEGRLEEAISTYVRLQALMKRLEEVGALGFPVDDVRSEQVATEDRLAKRLYDEGIAAHEADRWLDAVVKWEAARDIRPDYRDTSKKMAEALHLQALSELEAKKYGHALDHFDQSHALDNNPLSAAWAASIRVGWGRQDLKAGACRSAWEKLDRAKAHSLDPGLGDDIERARRCARVEVVVEPFEDLTGRAVQGTALGALLSDQMEATLLARGSPHLRLLDATSAPPAPDAADGLRYAVKGRVTRFQVEEPADAAEALTVTGATYEPCDAAGADTYTEADGFLCESTVTVAYTRQTKRRIVHLAGSLRVVDGAGTQRLSQPIETAATSEIVWVEAFTAAGEPVKVGESAAYGVVAIPAEILALAQPPGALIPEGTLVSDAVAGLATGSATAVLQTVDAPPTPPVPGWVDVKEPVTRPEGIEFKAPDAATTQGDSAPI